MNVVTTDQAPADGEFRCSSIAVKILNLLTEANSTGRMQGWPRWEEIKSEIEGLLTERFGEKPDGE